jgi:hypothetical protein
MKKKVLEIVLFISQAISTFLILQRALAQQTLNGSMEKEGKKREKLSHFSYEMFVAINQTAGREKSEKTLLKFNDFLLST